MKKTVLILLWLCFAITITMGQESELMKKYWSYRNRFHKYFAHLGTNPGDGLPGVHRPLRRLDEGQFQYHVQYKADPTRQVIGVCLRAAIPVG